MPYRYFHKPRLNQLMNELMTEVYVEQPLASPGSAKNVESVSMLKPPSGGMGLFSTLSNRFGKSLGLNLIKTTQKKDKQNLTN